MAKREFFKKYQNLFWAENKINFPDEEFIIKLDYPRVFIRYKLTASFLHADYKEFVSSIAQIQWIDGANSKPSKEEQEKILIDMYNYMVLEERLLEQDLEDIDIEDIVL